MSNLIDYVGSRVLIFRDIKNKRWTVWDTSRKRHLFYCDEIFLKKTTMFVDEIKRKIVVDKGRRFPHAWILGEITISPEYSFLSELRYNPFFKGSFYSKNKNIKKSKFVHFKNNGKVYI